MVLFRSSLHVLALALAASAVLPERALAAPPSLTPGEYIVEGGGGVLILSRPTPETVHFSLTSLGLDRQGCALEGDLQGSLAILPTDLRITEEKPATPLTCVATFQPTADGVEVTDVAMQSGSAINPCRAFCAVHAAFGGVYFLAPPGCTGKERAAARAKFKRLYAAKSYTEAASALETLLDRCAKQVEESETGWIRNDLALTQYHLGRLADCRETLAPLAEDAARSDDDLRRGLFPNDFAETLPIVQATRHNLKLCEP